MARNKKKKGGNPAPTKETTKVTTKVTTKAARKAAREAATKAATKAPPLEQSVDEDLVNVPDEVVQSILDRRLNVPQIDNLLSLPWDGRFPAHALVERRRRLMSITDDKTLYTLAMSSAGDTAASQARDCNAKSRKTDGLYGKLFEHLEVCRSSDVKKESRELYNYLAKKQPVNL